MPKMRNVRVVINFRSNRPIEELYEFYRDLDPPGGAVSFVQCHNDPPPEKISHRACNKVDPWKDRSE